MRISGTHYQTVWFEEDALHLINQPLLPHRFEVVHFTDFRDVAVAIRTMVVRGAPAIGATGAFAMALAAIEGADLDEAASLLGDTRPTAQDLFYGIDVVRTAAVAAPSARRAAAAWTSSSVTLMTFSGLLPAVCVGRAASILDRRHNATPR